MPRLVDMVRGEKFDPARSQEVFRVAMSDHASMIVLPSLLASVRKAATHLRLEVSASEGETYEDVAAGRIDTLLCATGLDCLLVGCLSIFAMVCLLELDGKVSQGLDRIGRIFVGVALGQPPEKGEGFFEIRLHLRKAAQMPPRARLAAVDHNGYELLH